MPNGEPIERRSTSTRSTDRRRSRGAARATSSPSARSAAPGRRSSPGTVRPGGRPQAAGTGAAWYDGDLYFQCGPKTRKARSVAMNPACTISGSLPGMDLVFEGEARRVADTPTLEAVAAVYPEGGLPVPRPVAAFTALVIWGGPGFGGARLHVKVGGEPVLDLTGDGLVVASPTGSTAYTVGAGGPAVSPTLDAIVLTPLAAQGTPLRSMVLDGSDTIRIEAAARSAPLAVEVDGRTMQDMRTPATVDIRTAAGKARLVRTRQRTVYGDLGRR